MLLKKRFLLVIIFFFVLSYANAQNVEVAFENKTIIEPPGPPEEPSKLDLSFELKDYNNKESIKDIHVYISILDLQNDIETNTLKYVDESGILQFKLYPSYYKIKLKVDDLSTLGKDYYFESNYNILADINETIFLFPVGSLRGFVYEGDKAVKGANLKFECSADYGDTELLRTDSFGSFSNEWLAVGLCRVSAEYGKRIGFKDVDIKKGELADVSINLSKDIISGSYSNLLIFVFFILVIVVLVYFYNYRKKKERKKVEKEKVTKVELSSRTKDVLNTLKEKEKEIVDFLLENNYQSTQAKIRNYTGIPKTSLARLFIGLEAKNIIKVEKIGKLKKIKLTDWFLGKE